MWVEIPKHSANNSVLARFEKIHTEVHEDIGLLAQTRSMVSWGGLEPPLTIRMRVFNSMAINSIIYSERG